MSDARESRRAKLTHERAERDAERARDPSAYRAKIELQRLRYLLAEPFWTADQAAYIFAGLHPRDAEWGMTTFLPGGRDAYAKGKMRENRIADSLTYLHGLFDGEARAPSDWMRRAVKFKVRTKGVPWLPAAIQDAECAECLPNEWRKRAKVIISAKRRGQAGGEARKTQTMQDIGVEFWNRFPDGVIPWGSGEGFVQEMYDRFKDREDAPTLESIRNEVTKLKKQNHRA